MATFTAQILVGSKHPYDSGIATISHTLYLSENSRPAWILTGTDIHGSQKQPDKKMTWIPTLKNMLEDALVMIGLYVLKDEKLLAIANAHFKNPNSDFIELYRDIDSESLQELYKQARSIESKHKIMVTVYQGSTILNQLSVLEKYHNDVEVCQSIFKMEFSVWSREVERVGVLEEVKI
ncbi:hypothetical protein LCL95_09095 [Bacillus timonensis]|nr:hypothetical protein [Bacillus timonensis]